VTPFDEEPKSFALHSSLALFHHNNKHLPTSRKSSRLHNRQTSANMSEVRQRKVDAKPDESRDSKRSATDLAKEEDVPRITMLEVLRSLTLLVILGGLVTWFVTRNNFLTDPNRHKALRMQYWQSLIVC